MSDLISVRFSHLLGFAGIGSIVRSEDWLYTVIDTSKWPQHTFLPYVERVRLSLEIAQDELHEPPKGKLDQSGRVQGAMVPGIRFPSWMHCRKCGLVHWQWWKQAPDARPRCSQCRTPLDQFPWVMIDTDGRMDDVPWHWLLHHDGLCKEDRRNPHLRLYDNRSAVPPAPTSGTAARTSKRWTLRCEKCHARRDLDEKEAAYDNPRFFRHQPWRGDNPANDGSAAKVFIVDVSDPRRYKVFIVDVSDPRLYAVPPCSALVIPPESRIERGSVVDRLYCNRSLLNPILNAKNLTHSVINQAASRLNCSSREIRDAVDEIRNGFPLYREVFTPGQLLEDEFKAIVTPFDPSEGEDFVTFHRTAHWRRLSEKCAEQRHLIRLVSRLIEVKRLREVRVFRGFSRANGGKIVPPDIDGAADWLPAIDLFGEGLFFCLDEIVLNAWEQQPAFANRLETLQKRYAQSGLTNHNELWLPGGRITPRFMLLHTLAHLLIRQIEASAGYPAASLKERLYCSPDMAGILIYVAVPDIVGSLGGLSELSQPERFLALLAATLDKADWCSLDPVCSEHEGQGPHLLNFAACHGCALIPEPACLFGNELLDRTFVKGDERLKIVGIAEYSRRHTQ